MFFSAMGLMLVLIVMLSARARHLEDMTAGWRIALYGALGLFFGGFFADGHVSGIFHWYGKTGLFLVAGGDAILWSGVSLMVVWIGLRAAMRLRRDGGEGTGLAVTRAGSRLDIMVLVIAGLALSNTIPSLLDTLKAAQHDLAAPPVAERVTFRMIHVYEDKTRRWASERRDAVFLRESGEEIAIPMPITRSFDEQKPLSPVTRATAGEVMELTYYPSCTTVVQVQVP